MCFNPGAAGVRGTEGAEVHPVQEHRGQHGLLGTVCHDRSKINKSAVEVELLHMTR